MLKFQKNEQTNFLSFCAHKKLKMIRGVHFEFQ